MIGFDFGRYPTMDSPTINLTPIHYAPRPYRYWVFPKGLKTIRLRVFPIRVVRPLAPDLTGSELIINGLCLHVTESPSEIRKMIQKQDETLVARIGWSKYPQAKETSPWLEQEPVPR